MGGKEGICQFCLKDKKLIHAHIVPKCFQKSVRGEDNSLFLYHADSNRYQDTFDYLFDKSILCAECDNSFSYAEQYTSRLLNDIRTNQIEPNLITEQIEGLEYYYTANTYLVKKALLSILWRMSVTQHKRYKNVALGIFQDKLRDRLKNEDLKESTFFPLSIITLKNSGDVRGDLLPTYIPSFEHLGSQVYQIQLPGFIIFIHVTAAATFDCNTTSIEDDQTLVIVEEKGQGAVKHLDRIYFIPFIPKSTN